MNYNYGTASTAISITTNYSEKMKWHMKTDPMQSLIKHLAHEIQTHMDDEIIKSINGTYNGTYNTSTVGDGSK